MNPKDLIKYWQTTANDDLQTAESLMAAKRYHHALFFCHLALEKLLKGLVFQHTSEHAFPIHELKKLARQAKLALTPALEKQLDEITTWNIRARYDNYKREFYTKATRQFATKWFARVKEIFLWLKQQF